MKQSELKPPTDRPVPKATDPEHLYEVKLVVLAPAGSSVDSVLEHVMAAVLLKEDRPLSVVVGYGASMKLLTNIRGMVTDGAMFCTSFTNKKIGKREKVPVMDPPKREEPRECTDDCGCSMCKHEDLEPTEEPCVSCTHCDGAGDCRYEPEEKR